jgi:hypothetical protein
MHAEQGTERAECIEEGADPLRNSRNRPDRSNDLTLNMQVKSINATKVKNLPRRPRPLAAFKDHVYNQLRRSDQTRSVPKQFRKR